MDQQSLIQGIQVASLDALERLPNGYIQNSGMPHQRRRQCTKANEKYLACDESRA
jgi:hypothetical protein